MTQVTASDVSRLPLSPPTDRGDGVGSARFVFIDALRGFAALAVLLHHVGINGQLEQLSGLFASGPVQRLIWAGSLGVQIFFVLSGFVIAHSLRRTPMNADGVGRFILRRQVRLDIPYWATIALVLGVRSLSKATGFFPFGPPPSGGDVLLNALYLHRICGAAWIVGVSWSLCIEIQFYLLFILILWVASPRGAHAACGPGRAVAAAVFLSGLACLAANPNRTDYRMVWFAPAWPYFVAGVLGYWAVRRQIAGWLFPAFTVGLCASCARFGLHPPVVAGVVTAWAIYGVGMSGRLTTLSGGRALQYLGAISYSLYLTHPTVILVVLRAGRLVTPGSRAAGLAWFAAAVAASLAAAHVFHHGVERPSVRLAARLRDPLVGRADRPPG